MPFFLAAPLSGDFLTSRAGCGSAIAASCRGFSPSTSAWPHERRREMSIPESLAFSAPYVA